MINKYNRLFSISRQGNKSSQFNSSDDSNPNKDTPKATLN